MNFRPRQIAPDRPRDSTMSPAEASVCGVAHAWQHTPGSCVPWKRRVHELGVEYSVGVNFHGLYQAIKSGHGFAKPVGIAWPTPEEAKAEADKDAQWAAA